MAFDDLQLRCRQCGTPLAWGEVTAQAINWTPATTDSDSVFRPRYATGHAEAVYEPCPSGHGVRTASAAAVAKAVQDHEHTPRSSPRVTPEPTRRPLVGGRTGSITVRA